MKKILVLLVALLMVGCEAKESEKPKQIIEKTVKQEQQVEQPKEEVKEEPKEEPKKEVKQVEKELPKKTEPKKEEPKKTEKELPKKEVEEEPEPGLIKDGTHLEEEARQASNKAGYSAVEAEANREARIAELEAELARLKNEK